MPSLMTDGIWTTRRQRFMINTFKSFQFLLQCMQYFIPTFSMLLRLALASVLASVVLGYISGLLGFFALN
jgi:hypothetical protein